MNNYFNQFFCEACKQYSLVIENDGRVCYAYLLRNKKVIGDVWIYNQTQTPSKTDWGNTEDMPFLNPSEYAVDDMSTLLISEPSDVEIKWTFSGNDCFLSDVTVYIKGKVAAILRDKAKPGWSINAKQNGPLANKLLDE